MQTYYPELKWYHNLFWGVLAILVAIIALVMYPLLCLVEYVERHKEHGI